MKRLLYAGVFLIVFLTFTGPALSYVLLPEQILSFMTKSMGKARTLQVDETILVYGEPESDPVRFSAKVDYLFPGQFREEAKSEETSRILVAGKKGVVLAQDGQLISETEDLFDLYKELLVHTDSESLLDRLASVGVDVSASSVGRLEDRIVLIVGAFFPDESRPQVWFDKKTFRPLRFIATRQVNGMNDQGVEFHYEDWRPHKVSKKSKRFRWYPHRIISFQDGQIVSERLADSVQVNTSLQPRLFDTGQLKDSLAPLDFSFEEKNYPGLDEVKKALEDFNKVYE